MTRLRPLLVVVMALGSAPALGAISLALAPNYDETRTTAYPSGDKPVAGCTPPSSWTEADVGDGFGEFCEQSATEMDASVGGSSSIQKMHYAYQAIAASGDQQIKLRVTDSYAGSTDSLAALGIGFRTGGGATDPFAQCFSPQSNGNSAQCNYGTTAAAFTNVNGAAGARPEYLCLTFDDSAQTTKGFQSEDGSAWNEIFSITDYDFSGGRVYFFGSSRSATETLQGTIDNLAVGTTIDCYTPSDPDPGSPPVLTEAIPNQSGVQGTAFSLTFSAYFTGATSHSVSGLPGSSGLSESSDGVLSGTPAAADVSASPYDLELCATNADGTTCDTAQFTFSAPPASGDVFTVPDVADVKSTFTCNNASTGANGASWTSVRTSGSGTTVGPGDTILITSGSRGAVELVNCNGASGNPITVKKTASGTRLTITGAGDSSAAFTFRNSTHVTVDGLSNWTGNTDGCGVDSNLSESPLTDCGILVDFTNQRGFSCRERCQFITVQGVEIDGNWPVNATRDGGDNGFNPNDPNYCVSTVPAAANREFREGITFDQNYFHHTATEAMYFGPNVNYGNCGTNEETPRLKDITITNNYIRYGGWDGIELKSAWTGTNLIERNVVLDIGGGVAGSGANSRGISFFESEGIARYNRVGRTNDPPGGAAGIICSANNAPAEWGVLDCQFYGNVVYDADGTAIAFTKAGGAAAGMSGDAYNNTVVDAGGSCISVNANVDDGGIVRDNICAGTSTNISLSGAGWSQSNNRSGTVAAQNFTSAASDDYSLTSSSPARNNGTANCPTEDLLGTSRPQGAACDQGAYEFDE